MTDGGLDGRPYGYEIEKIIELTLGTESDLPEISDWLSEKLKAFDKAVEREDKEYIQGLYTKRSGRLSPRRAVLMNILKLCVREFAMIPLRKTEPLIKACKNWVEENEDELPGHFKGYLRDQKSDWIRQKHREKIQSLLSGTNS